MSDKTPAVSAGKGAALPSPRMSDRPPLSPRVSTSGGGSATPAAKAAAERARASAPEAEAAKEREAEASSHSFPSAKTAEGEKEEMRPLVPAAPAEALARAKGLLAERRSSSRSPSPSDRHGTATVVSPAAETKREGAARPLKTAPTGGTLPNAALTASATVSPSPSTTSTPTRRRPQDHLATASTDTDGNSAAAALLTQKEADQLVAVAVKLHKQEAKAKDEEVRTARRELERAEKELAKAQAKLQDTQLKLEAEKASHNTAKAEAKEKQSELNKEWKRSQKEVKDAASRELKLQKEVEKLSKALEAAAAAAATAAAPAAGGSGLTPRGASQSLSASASSGGVGAELERARERAAKAEERSRDADAARTALERDVAQLRKDLAEAQRQSSAREREVDRMQRELAQLKAIAAAATPNEGSAGGRSPRRVSFSLPPGGDGGTEEGADGSCRRCGEREAAAAAANEQLRKALEGAEAKAGALAEANARLTEESATLQKLVDHLKAEEREAEMRATWERAEAAENAEELTKALREKERAAAQLVEEREGLRRELQRARKRMEDDEAESRERREKLRITEEELGRAKQTITKLEQQQQPEARVKSSPDKESQIKIVLERLTSQEAAFAKERESYQRRLLELEDAVCEIQSQADERTEEVRALASSLEESERSKEHVLATYTAKVANLQAQLAHLQARHERDVWEAQEAGREELSVDVDRLQEELTMKEEELSELRQQLSQASAAAEEGRGATEIRDALERTAKELEGDLTTVKQQNVQLEIANDQLRQRLASSQADDEEQGSKQEAVAREQQQQLHQEKEARERLEAEVLSLKETMKQLQQQQQQQQQPRQKTPLTPTSAAPPTPVSGHSMGFFAVHDQPSPTQQLAVATATISARPSRARSPQRPHCLDNACFDPTGGAASLRAEEELLVPHREDGLLSSALRGTGDAGREWGGGSLPSPVAGAMGSSARSPFRCQPSATRALHLGDISHDGNASRSNVSDSERGRVNSRSPERAYQPAITAAIATPLQQHQHFMSSTESVASHGAAGTPSRVGAQPFFLSPPSPAGLSFTVSAGRLLVSHRGRRLERRLFQSSAASSLLPQHFPDGGGGGGGSGVVSTSALTSLSHKLHVARSRSTLFAFTIRLLDLKHGSRSRSEGVLIGFADRFLPMEGFGDGRNSLRYEQCYYLNMTTGRLFCPGRRWTTDRPLADARYVDVPYTGWIQAASKAVAARSQQDCLGALIASGSYQPSSSPLPSSFSASASATSPLRTSSDVAVGRASSLVKGRAPSDLSAAPGDEVTCVLNVEQGSISYTWNGVDCGVAVTGLDLATASLYPAVEVNEDGVVLELL